MTASILFSIDLLLTIMIEIKAAIKIIVTKICIILRKYAVILVTAAELVSVFPGSS